MILKRKTFSFPVGGRAGGLLFIAKAVEDTVHFFDNIFLLSTKKKNVAYKEILYITGMPCFEYLEKK